MIGARMPCQPNRWCSFPVPMVILGFPDDLAGWLGGHSNLVGGSKMLPQNMSKSTNQPFQILGETKNVQTINQLTRNCGLPALGRCWALRLKLNFFKPRHSGRCRKRLAAKIQLFRDTHRIDGTAQHDENKQNLGNTNGHCLKIWWP